MLSAVAASHWPRATDWIAPRTHFGAVGPDIQAERQDGDGEGIERDAELRQHEKQPEQLH